MDNSSSTSSTDKSSKPSKSEPSLESDSSNSETSPVPKERKLKISLSSLGLNLRRGRSKRNNKKAVQQPSTSSSSSSSSSTVNSREITIWGIKIGSRKIQPVAPLNCPRVKRFPNCTCHLFRGIPPPGQSRAAASPESESDASNNDDEDGDEEEDESTDENTNESSGDDYVEYPEEVRHQMRLKRRRRKRRERRRVKMEVALKGHVGKCLPDWDWDWMRKAHEDSEEHARQARAREIEQGIDPPPNYKPVRRVQVVCPETDAEGGQGPRRLQLVCPPGVSVESLKSLFQNNVTLQSCPLDTVAGCHTQIDFIHCLVPDLLQITNCSFYWGKMDRYEAERLLEGKPEGTFLLRDSAQEEFLFSVSFRKYGRSLHARIEQWKHKFSFDSHDPGVYNAHNVCGLIEHYKDPSSCMFFEPMLTWPLHRNFTFSLQHLSRAAIVDTLAYDDINLLQLPKTLKSYLKEYHYRQKVRVERFDEDIDWLDLTNTVNATTSL